MRAKLFVVVTVALLVAWARLAGSGAIVSISDAQVDTSDTSIELSVTPKDKELDAEWTINPEDFNFKYMSIQWREKSSADLGTT